MNEPVETEQRIQEDPNVIELNEQLVNPDGSLKHQYFRSVWRFQYPPYTFCPFFVNSYNAASKQFSITVLTDKRPVNHVPLGYPVVQITEDEAQQIVDHRRSSPDKTKSKMELSNQNTTTAEPVADASAGAEETKKGRKSADGKPSIRELALAGFAENKSQNDIIASVKEVYSDKEEKKIRSLVSLYRYQEKKKKTDAAPTASPADSAPAETPAPAAS